VAQAIDLIDQGVLKVNYFTFAKDLMASILRLYAHYTADEVFSFREFGTFFPEVLNDISRYIIAWPELRVSLEKLKSAGKKLFLGTNSHEEYMHVIMTQTLGKGWEHLFELNCANCRKPNFFWKD
jgi:phosphoglycolate phosphatase-like HAD superfamily hydrolase